MSETKVVAISRPSPGNTPPPCAICLGDCVNKSFSDACLHKFCFQCLWAWSKIKAECPLCKQPFKSIIDEQSGEQNVVEQPSRERSEYVDSDDMWYYEALPYAPHHTRHEFHLRTTFTVDTRGEHAIQQMLLTHPLTNSGRITVNAGVYQTRHRRDYMSTSFRRSIYAQDLWVTNTPDITGRFRECSPTHFRHNPAARHRLAPWLNRELNALLYENTHAVMHVVDLIMDRVTRYDIRSRSFRTDMLHYLGPKTDHFVHEFYNFVRSPYDMIGYDRNAVYGNRPESPTPIIEDTVEIPDNSDDSDVIIVAETNPSRTPTIILVESTSDSDEPVVVSSCNDRVPLPMPAPRSSIDLTEEGASSTTTTTTSPSVIVQAPAPSTSLNLTLPIKLRYKKLRTDERERRKRKHKRRHRQRRRSRSSSSSSTSRTSSDSSNSNSSSSGSSSRRSSSSSSRSSNSPGNESDDSSDGSRDWVRMRDLKSLKRKRKSRRVRRSASASSPDSAFRRFLKKQRQPTGNGQVSSDSETDNKPLQYLLDLRKKRSDNFVQAEPIDLSAPSCSRNVANDNGDLRRSHTPPFPKQSQFCASSTTRTRSLSPESLTDYGEPLRSSIRIDLDVKRGVYGVANQRSEASNSGAGPPVRYSTYRTKQEVLTDGERTEPSTSKLILRRDTNKWYIHETDSSD